MARIHIVGGSLGGLMAANLLHRAGHEVQVLERSTRSLEGRGAGIVTHESLLLALRQCGAVLDDTLGVPVASRVVLDVDGRAAGQWAYPQLLTSWGRLYTLLRAALPDTCYRLGAPAAAVAQDDNGVSVQLPGGEVSRADLLIACDGIRSGVRAQLAPAVQPLYAGYVAWRGVCDEACLSRHTRETPVRPLRFRPAGRRADDRLPGCRCGQPHRAGPPPLELRLVPTGRGRHGAGSADDRRRRPAPRRRHPAAAGVLAPHRRDARRPRGPCWRRSSPRSSRRRRSPSCSPSTTWPRRVMAYGRIALLGDAAFVARPHVGMGVTKAGDDAMALRRRIGRRRRHAGGAAALRGAARRAECCRGRTRPPARRLPRGAAAPPRCRRDSTAVMRQTAVDPSPVRQPPARAPTRCAGRLKPAPFTAPEGDKPHEHDSPTKPAAAA